MRDTRGGQAVILLLLALGTFLLGALGLAVESSLYYTYRQMAQAAADAAAQATITSVYSRTNVGTNLMDGTAFTCTNGTDARTPCHFVRQHGYGTAGSSDVIEVSFPTSIPGVGDLSSETPAIAAVTVSRPVTTGFLQFVGAQAATIRARGVAAILIELSPVPILVMHPDWNESFQINGNPTIRICGGPPRSIQVNSISATSFGVSGGGGGSNFIDLSGAGPGSTTALSCDGSGGEFGNHGGPFDYTATSNGFPGGSIAPPDNYIQTLPIDDPLARPMPADPTNPGAPLVAPYTVPGGGVGAVNGCQRPVGRTCTVYSPGAYAGIDIQNDMALFNPGIYYITSGGFTLRSNSIAHMAPCTVANQHPVLGCGVLFYNDPQVDTDIFSISANSGQIQGVAYSQTLTAAGLSVTCTGNCFQGSAEVAPYYGVIFMNDRSTAFQQEHIFRGGGGLTIAGTLYFTNSFQPGKADLAGSANYQILRLEGTPGSTTRVIGQILADSLGLQGNAEINMTLNPNTTLPIRKLALVR